MGEFPTTIAIYIWHSQFSYQRNNLYYRLFTFTIFTSWRIQIPSQEVSGEHFSRNLESSSLATPKSVPSVAVISAPVSMIAVRLLDWTRKEKREGLFLGRTMGMVWIENGGGGSWSFPRMGAAPKNGRLILKFIYVKINFLMDDLGYPPWKSPGVWERPEKHGVFLHRTTPIFPPSPSQHLPTTSLVQKLGCILYYPKIAILFTNKSQNSTIK